MPVPKCFIVCACVCAMFWGSAIAADRDSRMAEAIPDPQYVMFVFALASAVTDAGAIAEACQPLIDVSQTIGRIRSVEREARGRVAGIPRLSRREQQALFRVSDEVLSEVQSVVSESTDAPSCGRLLAKRIEVMENVRDLVLDRERALGINAN